MGLCKWRQINDMPRGWQIESKLHKVIYDM